MRSSSEKQSESALPDIQPAVTWLKARGLALPAWALLELTRPLGWIAGQSLRLAAPLAEPIGLASPAGRLAALLEDPEALAALCDALAHDRERE